MHVVDVLTWVQAFGRLHVVPAFAAALSIILFGYCDPRSPSHADLLLTGPPKDHIERLVLCAVKRRRVGAVAG